MVYPEFDGIKNFLLLYNLATQEMCLPPFSTFYEDQFIAIGMKSHKMSDTVTAQS